MKIFISWSGPKAMDVALLLRRWLPSVIQSLEDPWVSEVDIESGANSSAAIGTELTNTKYGIVCVTKANQNKPWLNFEAGAISKLVGGATPLLVDFDNVTELTGGPMSKLQVRLPNKKDLAKLLSDINKRQDNPLKEQVLETTFERAFPEFEEAMTKINADPKYDEPVPPRPEEDKLDEILTLVRDLSRRGSTATASSVVAGEHSARRERERRAREAGLIPKLDGYESAKRERAIVDFLRNALEKRGVPADVSWDDGLNEVQVTVTEPWAAELDEMRGELSALAESRYAARIVFSLRLGEDEER